MLSKIAADNADREAETEMISKTRFIQGPCSNKFKQDVEPRIYYVSNDAITKDHYIPSIQVILEQCFAERCEEDCVIMCTSLEEARIAKSALENLCKPSKLYIPYLRGKYPSSGVKKHLLKVLESDTNIVLVSDYRSFRGCEAYHSIIFADYENPNIMAEMLSRTMADLDVIVAAENRSGPSPIQTAFNLWEKQKWVKSINVNSSVKDEKDESFTTITLHDSDDSEKKETKIEVEKPLFNLTFLDGYVESKNYS